MGKINTVNVTELYDGIITDVNSFTDDEEGQLLAEAMFTRLVLESGATTDELEEAVELGFFNMDDDEDGLTHGVALTDSNYVKEI